MVPVDASVLPPRGSGTPVPDASAARQPPAWLPAAAIAVVVIALPAGNLDVPGLGVALILPAAGAAAMAAAVVLLAARRALVVPSAILALAAGAVAVGALAVAAAPDAALALRLTVTATAGLLLAVLTAAACRRPLDWYGLLAVLLTVGAAVCAFSLDSSVELQGDFGGAVVGGRLTGVFGQPNELGAFAAVIAVLALAVLGTVRRLGMAVAMAVVLSVAIAALALSLSRGAWLGALGGALVLVVCLRTARRRLAAVLVLAALVWGAFAAAGSAATGTPTDGTIGTVAERAATIFAPETNPYDERPVIWREGLDQVRTAPLLGHGPGNFPRVAESFSAATPGLDADHAHNLALTTAAETGLIGLGMLIGAVLAGVLAVGRVLREGDHDTGTRAVTAAAALAVVLVQGAFDYPLRNAVLAMVTWLLVGLLAAATAPRQV